MTDDRDLYEAIENLYALDPPQRRLITLSNTMPRSLAQHLHRWVQGGPYANLFDNAEDTLTFQRVQCFDFEGLDKYPLLLAPLLFYVLHRASAAIDDPAFRTSPDDAMVASTEMYMMADGIAAARRECPMDDVASKLLAADVNGTALTQEEFDVFFMLLMVAGNETTRNAISHGMQAFFDHPEQWEIFKKERPLETAVEEIVRWATPVMQFQRTALSDYVLGGQTIKAGDRVGIYYSAANRDQTALDNPDTFDVRRANNEHIAFGGGGPHFCLGANLARATVRIMFNEIADRMPDIRPLGPPRPLLSMFINGIKEIPVAFV